MSSAVTNKEHWREVYRRQRLKNASLWLEEFERTADPTALAAANYDKLLQAIEQTLKHEDTFSVGCDLLREVTPIAFGMADWGRLLIYLKSALANLKRSSSRVTEAYLYEWIADIELSLMRLPEAEKNFQTALQLYIEEGEMVRYGRILPRLARVYVSKGQIAHALELCVDALRLGEGSGETIIIADALFGLAETYFRSNDWQEALNHCEGAITNYQLIGRKNFIFRTKVLEVTCNVFLERYDVAKVESDDLLRQYQNAEHAYDNIYDNIHLRRAIGFMAFRQNDYLTAEKHWQEAYRQNSMVGAPDLTASISNNLGKVYTIMGEYDAAEQMLIEALDLFEQLGDVPRWANCMDNLVDLFEAKGDLPACRQILKKAISKLEPEAKLPHSHKLLLTMQQRLQKLPKI